MDNYDIDAWLSCSKTVGCSHCGKVRPCVPKFNWFGFTYGYFCSLCFDPQIRRSDIKVLESNKKQL